MFIWDHLRLLSQLSGEFDRFFGDQQPTVLMGILWENWMFLDMTKQQCDIGAKSTNVRFGMGICSPAIRGNQSQIRSQVKWKFD